LEHAPKTKERQINLHEVREANDDDDQLHHNKEGHCDDGVDQKN
jgi:hypothetical protein